MGGGGGGLFVHHAYGPRTSSLIPKPYETNSKSLKVNCSGVLWMQKKDLLSRKQLKDFVLKYFLK